MRSIYELERVFKNVPKRGLGLDVFYKELVREKQVNSVPHSVLPEDSGRVVALTTCLLIQPSIQLQN